MCADERWAQVFLAEAGAYGDDLERRRGPDGSGRINNSAVKPGDILQLVVVTAVNKGRLVATVAHD